MLSKKSRYFAFALFLALVAAVAGAQVERELFVGCADGAPRGHSSRPAAAHSEPDLFAL